MAYLHFCSTASYVPQDLIFNFQCSYTAFMISVLRITIFAHYIDIMLAQSRLLMYPVCN